MRNAHLQKVHWVLLLLVWLTYQCGNSPDNPPNVVLIMTDDQGYGDLGFHGNPLIQTPNLDRLAEESFVHSQFYVSPVCAPTRASLMTGRYHYRTGVVETYPGLAMMYPDEVTLAELLADAGYRTGIFGKWHLGDNYPLRAMDQGFQESLVHRGGGIGQPADPPGNEYFNPILLENGKDVSSSGYCTDIFFDAAIEFIEESRQDHFFVYIATNAPHAPLQIGDEYVDPYREKGLDEQTARVYGMITNIDENVGKLISRIEALGLEEDTILIFMSDNGPEQQRYGAGLRGRKSSVFEGGIRVPFFVRWPSQISPAKSEVIAAHIDVVPTLLEACGVSKPENVKVDGISLLSLWKGKQTDLDTRYLFFQTHRGDVPEMGRVCAVRTQHYKLVQPEGWASRPVPENLKWMLFDMDHDPGEEEDISSHKPELVNEMKTAYSEWFHDVTATRGHDPPRIALGTGHENPVILTRQDWRGPRASFLPDGLGYWEIEVKEAGDYAVRLRFAPTESEGTAELMLGATRDEKPFQRGAQSLEFGSVKLEEGKGRLEAVLHAGKESVGVHYVDVKKLAGDTPDWGN